MRVLVQDLLRVLRDEDETAAGVVNLGGERQEIGPQTGGDQHNGSSLPLGGSDKPGNIVALGDDSHVFFKAKDTSGTSTKDGLVIGEDDAIHTMSPVFCGIRRPRTGLIGACALKVGMCLLFGQSPRRHSIETTYP